MNPVARLGVFLRLQMTDGSSTSHFLPNFLNRLYILGLRPYRIMPLARSTWPFVLGCPTADQTTRMWWSSQNVRNLCPVNCVPLSVMMVFGTPNLWMISVKNNTACSDLI